MLAVTIASEIAASDHTDEELSQIVTGVSLEFYARLRICLDAIDNPPPGLVDTVKCVPMGRA